MNSLKNSTANTLQTLQALLPGITFSAKDSFYWSPKTQTVAYNAETLKHQEGVWSLIHEAAHAQLAHTTYKTDFELLLLEVAAWECATQIGKTLDIIVAEEHVQDCLDTYRDWLHRRSTCPTCGSVGLQHSEILYRCHNCNGEWRVTAARFCRPYRLKSHSQNKKSPSSIKNLTTFH